MGPGVPEQRAFLPQGLAARWSRGQGQGTSSGTCGEEMGAGTRPSTCSCTQHPPAACLSPHQGGHSHLQALDFVCWRFWILMGPAAAPPSPREGRILLRGQGCRVLRWMTPQMTRLLSLSRTT